MAGAAGLYRFSPHRKILERPATAGRPLLVRHVRGWTPLLHALGHLFGGRRRFRFFCQDVIRFPFWNPLHRRNDPSKRQRLGLPPRFDRLNHYRCLCLKTGASRKAGDRHRGQKHTSQ
jgi:hypothetical protein